MIRSLPLLAGALAALAASGSAHAQSTGFALDRYEPTPNDLFFASEFPWYTRDATWALRGGVVADYAHNPLVLRGSDGTSRSIVSNMLVLHPQISLALVDRVSINVSVPINVLQTGEMATTVGGQMYAATNGARVGDIRIGLRGRIFGDADRDAVSLHVSAYGFLGMIPISTRDSNVTDEAFRFRGQLTLAGHPGPLRYSFAVGAHYRPQFTTGAQLPANNGSTPEAQQIGTELIVTAALGYAALNDRLTVGPEAWMSSNLTQIGTPLAWNAEAILGAHYLIADTILVGAGVGGGLTRGPGTPDARAMLQIAYAPTPHVAAPRLPPPPPPDTDRDGVLDPDDQCVTEPMGAHPDPARRGCPIHDTDGDTVLDNEDQCVNEPRGDHPDPARAGCPAPDTDHDGVFDPDDQCVSEPAGDHPDPARAGCPDLDDDSDGFRNSVDQCRTEPAGLRPDDARPGCPAPDRDHDTVPDAVDHCPDQPGSPSPNPRRNGCPGLVRVENGMLRILTPVFFATNRDRILPRSNRVLTSVAEAIRATPMIQRVSVEGHTDDVGDDARNLDLSQRRAAAVVAWLIAAGLEPERFEAHGFGETRPVVPNRTSRARAQNRRVEFRIVPASSSSSPPSAPPVE